MQQKHILFSLRFSQTFSNAFQHLRLGFSAWVDNCTGNANVFIFIFVNEKQFPGWKPHILSFRKQCFFPLFCGKRSKDCFAPMSPNLTVMSDMILLHLQLSKLCSPLTWDGKMGISPEQHLTTQWILLPQSGAKKTHTYTAENILPHSPASCSVTAYSSGMRNTANRLQCFVWGPQWRRKWFH